MAPHPLQLFPRGALGTGQTSHRPTRGRAGPTGPRWLGAVRSAEKGGEGGAAAGGQGRGGRRGECKGGGGGEDEALPAQVPGSLGEESGPGLHRRKSPIPSCPSPSFPGAPWVHPSPTLAREQDGWLCLLPPGGGQEVCSCQQEWPASGQSSRSDALGTLSAATTSIPSGGTAAVCNTWRQSASPLRGWPSKGQEAVPAGPAQECLAPTVCPGPPRQHSGLGVAYGSKGGLLCRIGFEGGCMGKDPPPCPADPRGQEPGPSLPWP